MLNLLTSAPTRSADNYMIGHQSISSTDLMESAANAFTALFTNEFPYHDTAISIYCGTGNNGGDGLAIARLLQQQGYKQVDVKVIRFNDKSSSDFVSNLNRLSGIPVKEIHGAEFPEESAEIIIDALLGSGLNKPLSGDWKLLADHLNALNKRIIAVDIPTGFPSEGIINTKDPVVKADLVITFQRAKINFFFPESQEAIARFKVVNIGLDEGYIQSQETDWKLLTEEDIRHILKPRKQFSHKGTYGHALIIAGKKETMGAALLSSEACLHTGAGLTTACIPEEGLTALNTRSPEIMALVRNTGFSLPDLKKYTSIAAGPGLGTDSVSTTLIKDLLAAFSKPLVLDADALNILAAHSGWLSKLPHGSVLTPHMKEFDRLFGHHDSFWKRLETAKEQASRLKICILLKNRYTFIISPDKEVIINPTGSPAMATGGMGDVLTGMIVAFLAQGYEPLQACILSTYIHGLCGQYKGYVCTASELIKNIPGMAEGLMPK
jgi:hydroxyethylthiazole kinase-like uncharacterized protein yjeF